MLNGKKLAEYLGEGLGTFLLVLIILTSSFLLPSLQPFIFGVALAALIYSFGRYGQAHFNPVVTLGALFADLGSILVLKKDKKETKIMDYLIYLPVQLIASFLAYPLASWMRDQIAIYQAGPEATADVVASFVERYSLFPTYLEELGKFAFVMELLCVAVLVFTFLSIATNERMKDKIGLAMGSILFAITSIASGVTGASFHPFRALVPAIFDWEIVGENKWGFLGVYIGAAVLGAFIAALVYIVLEFLTMIKFEKKEMVETKKKK